MEAGRKRRWTYVATAIIGAMIVILAVLLLQRPIPISTVPNTPGNPGGGNNTTTSPSVAPPSVTTQAATAIGLTNATLHGQLTSLGTASSVAVGFQYSASTSFAVVTNMTTNTRTAPGTLSTLATGLNSNTTYYFRAWALGRGFVTGSALSFKTNAPSTPPPPPPPGGGGTGNGHQVPPGWAHAACPDVPERAPAHGVRARCEHNETWGQMKKQGQADVAVTPATPLEPFSHAAALRTSDPGNSGSHRSDQSRTW